MKRNLVFWVISLTCFSVFATADFSFSANTSVFGIFNKANNEYIGKEKNGKWDLIILQDAALKFSPVDSLSAFSDLSLYGSANHYKNDSIPIRTSFNFDINQLYINFDFAIGRVFVGKRVMNFGCASNFSLVNQINPRRNDKFRTVSVGAGVVGVNLFPSPWINLFFISYFDSDSTSSTYRNLSLLINSDFTFGVFSFSVYTYFKHLFDWPHGTIRDLFSDFSSFKDDVSTISDNVTITTAFASSVQLGHFTIYGEAVYNPRPTKFEVVNTSLSMVKKGIFWDAMLGLKYTISKFGAEGEYYYAMSGYNADEAEIISSFCRNDPSAVSKVYNDMRIFYRNNANIRLYYMPTPEWKISLLNRLSFPSYSCKNSYIGDKLSFALSYVYKQTLNVQLSVSYGFGGEKSEFKLFAEDNMSINLATRLYY